MKIDALAGARGLAGCVEDSVTTRLTDNEDRPKGVIWRRTTAAR
jgi:hypothetical protein